MSWWSTQPTEMKAAYVAAATTIVATGIGLLAPLIGDRDGSPASNGRNTGEIGRAHV